MVPNLEPFRYRFPTRKSVPFFGTEIGTVFRHGNRCRQAVPKSVSCYGTSGLEIGAQIGVVLRDVWCRSWIKISVARRHRNRCGFTGRLMHHLNQVLCRSATPKSVSLYGAFVADFGSVMFDEWYACAPSCPPHADRCPLWLDGRSID